MSTVNLAALKAAWVLEIAKISDALTKAEATQLLDEYIDARTAIADLQSGKVQSYSIGGRSFTFHTVGAAESLVKSKHWDLWRMVYGSTTLLTGNVSNANET